MIRVSLAESARLKRLNKGMEAGEGAPILSRWLAYSAGVFGNRGVVRIGVLALLLAAEFALLEAGMRVAGGSRRRRRSSRSFSRIRAWGIG